MRKLLLIIAILLTTHTTHAQGGDLPYSVPSYTPATANLVLHVDASLSASITIATGVSRWADQSGNAHDLLQATTTKQPVYSGSGTTSAVTFDGTSQFLKCVAFTLNQPITVYAVMKQVTWVSNAKIWDGNTNFSQDYVQSGTTPATVLSAGGTGPGSSTDFTINTYMVVSAVYNGASSTLSLNNGTLHTGNVGASNAGGFTLGAVSDGTQPGNIAVKEIYIYGQADNTTTQGLMVAFLRQKWGI